MTAMRAIFVGLLVLAAVGAAAQTGARGALFDRTAIEFGGRTGDIALADVNRDGHVDLIATRPPDPTVSVRLGDGKGAFTPAAGDPVAIPGGVAAIAVGDLNGDRAPDLVVANRDERREYIGVLLGDRAGRFRAATGSPYATGTAFAFYKPVLRVVDVNEDGRMDIVSTNGRRNTLEILFGDGGGAFSLGARVMLDAGGDFYTSHIADVDGDGHADVVSASGLDAADRVMLKRGDGRGGFGESVVLASTRPRPRVVALADLNRDTRVDLVVAHGETAILTVLLNGGGRVFTPAAGSPYTIAAEAFEVEVADINRDGMEDLVSATVDSRSRPYNASITLLLGSKSGFIAAPGSPFPVGHGAYNLVVGDVNSDGKVDAAASSFEGDPVTFLLGR